MQFTAVWQMSTNGGRLHDHQSADKFSCYTLDLLLFFGESGLWVVPEAGRKWAYLRQRRDF